MENLTEIEQRIFLQGIEGINSIIQTQEYFENLYMQSSSEEERLKYQTVLNNFQRYYQEMQTNY